MIRRLASFGLITLLGLAGAVLLLLASHQGESNRCHRLDPSSFAASVYCQEPTP